MKCSIKGYTRLNDSIENMITELIASSSTQIGLKRKLYDQLIKKRNYITNKNLQPDT